MLKKIVRSFNSKSLATFALAFFIGCGTNFVSGNYWFYFNVRETFTKAEAEAKLGKRVIDNCLDKSEPTKGTIVSYHRYNADGQIWIDIKWDKPFLGKYEKLGQSIETYSRCITEINESE